MEKSDLEIGVVGVQVLGIVTKIFGGQCLVLAVFQNGIQAFVELIEQLFITFTNRHADAITLYGRVGAVWYGGWHNCNTFGLWRFHEAFGQNHCV